MIGKNVIVFCPLSKQMNFVPRVKESRVTQNCQQAIAIQSQNFPHPTKSPNKLEPNSIVNQLTFYPRAFYSL